MSTHLFSHSHKNEYLFCVFSSLFFMLLLSTHSVILRSFTFWVHRLSTAPKYFAFLQHRIFPPKKQTTMFFDINEYSQYVFSNGIRTVFLEFYAFMSIEYASFQPWIHSMIISNLAKNHANWVPGVRYFMLFRVQILFLPSQNITIPVYSFSSFYPFCSIKNEQYSFFEYWICVLWACQMP